MKGKMCRKLKRKNKLNEENITTVKETIIEDATEKPKSVKI